ncbi:MAG TPA: ATP-binding cassette domain-containing protein, partial [Jiangellaceae bacterium]
SVADNMGFALKMQGVSKDDRAKRVMEAAKLLGLEEYLDRKPKALSGGQRQRVAMGRAIVRNPQVFLMDEPLSNLDAKLRVSTRTQIASLQRRLGITTVYVTHDQVEAMTMGDRVAVLKDGLLQQVDTPLNLYDQPANVFVAGFIGSPAMNIATFDVTDGRATLGLADVAIPRTISDAVGAEGSDTVTLGFRPESLEAVSGEEAGGIPVVVDVVEELGSDAYVYGHPSGPAATDLPDRLRSDTVIARVEPRNAPAKGEKVTFRIRSGGEHFFSVKTGERLGGA